MTSPKTKPVVTRADREAAWRWRFRDDPRFSYPDKIDSADLAWVETGALGEYPYDYEELSERAEFAAICRTEAHAAGYAECQRDVVEWARGSMSDRHTSANWDAKDTALDELAEGVEAGEHVGAAKEVERG
jgi:hypothetical protein